MITLRSSDLFIKTLDDNREVIQLRGGLAFDPEFISEMRQAGVREMTIDLKENEKQKKEEKEEEEKEEEETD